MGPAGLACPLCCGDVFPSRESLRRHLEDAASGLRCPACQLSLPSMLELMQHLEAETCSGGETTHTDQSMALSQSIEVIAQDHFHGLIKMEDLKQETTSNRLTFVDKDNNPLDVMGDGGNHILIVGDGSAGLLGDQNIITTQHEDGTISFTPIEPEAPECVQEQLSPSTEEDDGEVYSCNTCGVSFTSVLEHIQTYHSEQDVVVEVAEAESDNLAEEMQAVTSTKRVITTSGDIVETHSLVPDKGEQGAESGDGELCVDKDGRTYTRRFVRIDKFWSAEDAAPAESTMKEIIDFDEKSRLYNCRRCNTKTTKMQEMDVHVCKADGLYICAHCPVTYLSAKSLCAHMKVHKTATSKSKSEYVLPTATEQGYSYFKCFDCDTVFPSNKSLRLHRRMHEPVKSRPMEGPIEYNSADKPKGDPGGGGGGGGEGEDTYHCTVCDKWIHEGYRQIHNNFHDTSGAEQHHCEICNRKFPSRDYLLMHMNVHNVEKVAVVQTNKSLPYSCLYCTRQFARPHEKVKHERIHTGEKPHSCEICGKSFRVSYCLTLHMRTHTGARPYGCPHCGKRFKAHSVYNHHLLTHSEVRAYKCPFCPKAFKTSVQLAGHKNSHTKPFSCTQCNRPFASLYAVRVHTETHRRQNNLKFSCKLCGASYARVFALKDHMRSAHSQEAGDNLPDYSSGIPDSIFETDSSLVITSNATLLKKAEHLESTERDLAMI